MNQKNILFFVIDSVYDKHIQDTPYRHSPMPFLNKLQKKSITTSNMYAQAPFTEGAIMPLLGGSNLLDRGGYMQKFKYRRSILERFQANGYDTFINHYYPSVYPSRTYPGANHTYYQSFFQFSEVWSYRFSYYAPLYLNGELSDIEISMLKDILCDNLEAWIEISQLLLRKDPAVEILTANADLTGLDEELVKIKSEYEKFIAEPDAYLTELFKQKEAHPLFQIKVFSNNRRVDAQTIKKVQQRYRPVFDLIYQTNKKKNLKNLPIPLGRTCSAMLKGNFHAAYRYLAMYKNALWDKDLYERIDDQYPNFKAAVPAINFIDHAIKWLDERQSQKPFFAYLHVDDAHAPESFFTTNSSDFDLLDYEFAAIKSYIKNLPASYHGSLTSDLSLLYVDGCLRHLFDALEQRGLLDHTAVVITADHGFSYSYDPIRSVYVNNPHMENYNVPFILYDRSYTPQLKEGFYQTKDIPPTLLDLCDITIPADMNGKSILKFEGREQVFLEYMGGGCPDMLRRDMVFGVRTARYSVVLSVGITEDFSQARITHVFHLLNDPHELKNLAGKISRADIAPELKLLEERFFELKKDFTENPNAFNTPHVFENRRKETFHNN